MVWGASAGRLRQTRTTEDARALDPLSLLRPGFSVRIGHVPVIEKNGNNIKVTVGSTIHPMEEKHYIEWIAIVKDSEINLKKLEPNMEPIVELPYINNSIVYAYCNIHGLCGNKLD